MTGWTPDDATFGARLALVRQRMGWGNVKEAATQCGVPVESWRTWERDNVAPRNVVNVAAKIADRTGCNYGWLLAGPRLQHEPSAMVRPNNRSGRVAGRAGMSPERTTTERRARAPQSTSRPVRESTRPTADVSPTRRRPMPVRPAR